VKRGWQCGIRIRGLDPDGQGIDDLYGLHSQKSGDPGVEFVGSFQGEFNIICGHLRTIVKEDTITQLELPGKVIYLAPG
jgi:hypothetical protein